MQTNENKQEKTIEQVLQQKKKDRKKKITLIIIIILLILMFYLLGYRLEKIGYGVKEVSANPEEGVKLIQVMQDDLEITKDTDLDIFVNEKLEGKKVIAPNSKGKYRFCIENKADQNIIYNIKFSDEMNHKINMKYKLKIDNVYIKGNKEKYVDINELNADEIIAMKDSINVFTLEWCWIPESEEKSKNEINDTYLGVNYEEEYYRLNLKVEAAKINE